MKTKRTITILTSIIAFAALFVIVAISSNTLHVKAFNPQPDPPAFAYIGLIFNQTARLSVSSDRDVAPGPCRQVNLKFVDAEGNTLAESTQNLVPNRGAFLDLNRNLLPSTSARAEVRPFVACLATDNPENDRSRSLVADVQIFNSETGKTEIILPAVYRGLPAVQR